MNVVNEALRNSSKKDHRRWIINWKVIEL